MICCFGFESQWWQSVFKNRPRPINAELAEFAEVKTGAGTAAVCARYDGSARKRCPMNPRLQVDPINLHLTSTTIGVAVEEHATTTAAHREDFSDGALRWRGSARAALNEVLDRWQARHTARQRQVSHHGLHVHEAAQGYAAQDHDGQDRIRSVPLLGSR